MKALGDMERVTKTSIDKETISQADLHLIPTSFNDEGKYIAELGLDLKRSSSLPEGVYLLKVKCGILFKLREQSSRVLYYMTLSNNITCVVHG